MSLAVRLFAAIVSVTVLIGLFANNEAIRTLAATVLFFTIIVAAIIALFYFHRKRKKVKPMIPRSDYDNGWD